MGCPAPLLAVMGSRAVLAENQEPKPASRGLFSAHSRILHAVDEASFYKRSGKLDALGKASLPGLGGRFIRLGLEYGKEKAGDVGAHWR